MTNKTVKDYKVVEATKLAGGRYACLALEPVDGTLPSDILPGQFAQVAVEVPGVMLRRPISINYVDYTKRQVRLLVRDAGCATHRLVNAKSGDTFNMLMPLGNGFTLSHAGERVLLVGGGVGVAPLLCLGAALVANGAKPEFLLGARTAADQLQLPEFEALGKVYISTEDGSMGAPGTVVDNPVIANENFDRIYCCGPMPMMKAVASVARRRGIDCEVSLENMMACGLGACLCCVEKTVKGNVCVCTEGPVFNINQLTW